MTRRYRSRLLNFAAHSPRSRRDRKFRSARLERAARVRDQPDPAAAHALWREGRDRMMRSHPQSPLRAADPIRARGVPYGPYDPALRWIARVEPVSRPRRLAIDTGPDGVTRLEQAGWVTLADPVRQRVALWWLDQYGGGLFLPLRDATAGTTSYGGGRFLLDTAKGADLGSAGRSLVIDLNFLYHPSCRYDSRWTCPLAPDDNVIDLPHPGRGAASPAMSPGRRPCVQDAGIPCPRLLARTWRPGVTLGERTQDRAALTAARPPRRVGVEQCR